MTFMMTRIILLVFLSLLLACSGNQDSSFCPPGKGPPGLKEKIMALTEESEISRGLSLVEELINQYPENYGVYQIPGKFYPPRISRPFLEKMGDNPFALWARGHLYLREKEPAEALPLFRQAIEIRPVFYEAYEDFIRTAFILREPEKAENFLLAMEESPARSFGLSSVHLKKRDFKTAEKELAAYLESGADITPQAYAMYGYAQMSLGNPTLGLAYGLCALEHFTRHGDPWGELKGLISLGINYNILGERQKALDLYDQALIAARRLKDEDSRTLILLNQGQLYARKGDYPRAQALQEEALTLCLLPGSGSRRYLYSLYSDMGNTALGLGDYDRGMDNFNKALEEAEKNRNTFGEALARGNRGHIFLARGEYETARESFLQSLTLYEKLGAREQAARTMDSLGETALLMKDFRKAEDFFRKALTEKEKAGSPGEIGSSLYHLGSLYFARELYASAFEYYTKAAPLLRDQPLEEKNSGKMGLCAYHLGDYALARHYLTEAIGLTESMRHRLISQSHKADYIQQFQPYYETLLEVYYQLNGGDPVKQKYLTFALGEKMRARGLYEMLKNLSLELPRGLKQKIAEQDRIYEEKNRILKNERQKEPVNLKKIRKLEKEQEVLEREYEEVQNKNLARNKTYTGKAPLTQPQELQRKLLPGTLIAEYQFTPGALYLWLITRDKFELKRINASRKKTEMLIRRLSAELKNKEDITVTAGELYGVLIPGEVREGVDRLIVIPGETLAPLAFELLFSPDRSFLGELVKIQYLQSASVYHHLLENRKYHKTNRSLMIAGAPDYQGRWQDLPFSLRETEKISALFSNKMVLTGNNAVESTIKTPGLLEEYGILHFATHARVNSNHSSASALVLAEEEGEDGFLQVREIFNLRTSADIVILSACSSGGGKYTPGEGIMGLAESWFYAGASTLIVSLREVDDYTGALFMEQFYNGLTGGKTGTEALRLTRLWMKERYPHPYYWAPFILMGLDCSLEPG